MNTNFRTTVGWRDNNNSSSYGNTSQQQSGPTYSYGYSSRSDLPSQSTYESAYSASWGPSASLTSERHPYGYFPGARAAEGQSQQGSSSYYQQHEYNPEYPAYSYTTYSDKNVYRQEFPQYSTTSTTTYVPLNTSVFSTKNAYLNQSKKPLKSRLQAPTFPKLASKQAPQPLFKKAPIASRVTRPISTLSVKPISNLRAINKASPPIVDELEEVKIIGEKKAPTKSEKTGGRKKHRGGRNRKKTQQQKPIQQVTPKGIQKRANNSISKMSQSGSTSPGNQGNNKRRSGGGGGRFHRGGKRHNGGGGSNYSSNDIPHVPLGDNMETINLTIDPDNIVTFHGFRSVFTPQHSFPVMIDDRIYESIDHYYQIQKVNDLCGTSSEKLTETVRDSSGSRLDGKVGFRSHDEKSFSQLAKEMLKLNNVEKKTADEWRYSKGLEATQKGFLAKISQSAQFREELRDTGSKILVHAYGGDSVYGCGTHWPQIKKWSEEMKANMATTLKIPALFPLTTETIAMCPNFAQGRNVLGVILMQLRELLLNSRIQIEDMSAVFDALRDGKKSAASTEVSNDVFMQSLDEASDGFSIGGGSMQAKMGAAH